MIQNSSLYIVSVVSALCLFASCRHSATPTEQGAIPVSVVVPSASADDESRSYSGTVETAQNSAVSFSVPGTISHIYVAEGQRVGKGQILARIKSESLANASNIAQATLKEARDAYNRLKKLRDANALPEIKWVEVQSKLEQAENAAAIAAREVSDAAIYAPAAGIVSKKFAEVGQNVAPDIPVFSIVSVDDIKVSIPVPGDEIGGIAEGDKAKVSFDALGGASVDGVVAQKGVVADPLTRAYDVKIAISGQDGKVLPGMTCGVVLKKAGDVAGVTLPSQAVQLGSDNRNFVWLVRGGKAERRFVTSGGMVAGGIYVTDGISAGDSVSVAGMHKVSSGTPVSAVIENK